MKYWLRSFSALYVTGEAETWHSNTFQALQLSSLIRSRKATSVLVDAHAKLVVSFCATSEGLR